MVRIIPRGQTYCHSKERRGLIFQVEGGLSAPKLGGNTD